MELVKDAKIGWLTREYMIENGRRPVKKYAKIMKIN